MDGWIGVDFDGTLAKENIAEFPTPGAPIPKMINRIKGWLDAGREVRIVTARVGPCTQADVDAVGFPELTPELWIFAQRAFLETWCLMHIGQTLPITAEKDFRMIELWDDRAIQMIPNTGMTLDEEIRMRNATVMAGQVRNFLNN